MPTTPDPSSPQFQPADAAAQQAFLNGSIRPLADLNPADETSAHLQAINSIYDIWDREIGNRGENERISVSIKIGDNAYSVTLSSHMVDSRWESRYELLIYGYSTVLWIGQEDGALLLTGRPFPHTFEEVIHAMGEGIQISASIAADARIQLNEEFILAADAAASTPRQDQILFAERLPEAAAILTALFEEYRIHGGTPDSFQSSERMILERALEKILTDPKLTVSYSQFLDEQQIETPKIITLDAGTVAQILADHLPTEDRKARPLRDVLDSTLFKIFSSIPNIIMLQDQISQSVSEEWLEISLYTESNNAAVEDIPVFDFEDMMGRARGDGSLDTTESPDPDPNEDADPSSEK